MAHIRWLKPTFIWALWGLMLAGLQTTVWPLLFAGVPAPQLWLNSILFFILFRPTMRALFASYLWALLFYPFTSLALGVFWLTFLILVPVGSSIKARTFWPGVRYFMIGSLLLSGGWHIASFAVSQLVEKNPASLHLFTRLTEILLTPLAAYPQYFIMQRLERWMHEEPTPQFGGVEE